MEAIPQSCFDMINDIRGETTLEDAKGAYVRGEYKEAAKLYTELIQSDDYNSEFYTSRALCFIHLEKYDMAISDSKLVINKDSSNIHGYLLAGRASVMLKRYEEALSLYQRGLQVEPKNPEIAQDLKDMQKCIVQEYELKGTEKGYSAVKFCSQDPYPGDDMLLDLEKDILEKKYLPNQAKETVLTKRDPKTAMAQAMLGEQHRMRDDLSRALCHLSQAVIADPYNFALRFLRAKAYMQNGDTEKGIVDFMAIPKAARHKEIWKAGGMALLNLQLPVMAELWLRRASKLSEESDDECAILFQQARVKRLYSPLTLDFPIEVRFTQYGRAVFAKEATKPGTIVLKDGPIICGNSMDSWGLPVCSHCGQSLLSSLDYFGDFDKLNDLQKSTVEEHWPKITVIECDLCNMEVYCDKRCKVEAWERYHCILCPHKTPTARKLYEICQNNGKMFDSTSNSWQEVWSAAYTPLILAKMWAFVVCEVRRLMREEGTEISSLEQWGKAKAPLRRFIAYGSNDASKRFPEVHRIMQDIFSSCDPQYEITDKEFNGRYYQATCNLQSFSSPLSPYKLFLNNLNKADVQEAVSMLKLVETKPKDAIFTGLFPLHACLNHSCLNNAEVMDGLYFDKPSIWVRAKLDIKADDELFITYIDTKIPRKLRRAWLFRSFNFWCTCRRCQFEGDEPETCTNCLKSAESGKKFLACGKCKKAWYCSVNCQKDAWKRGHREICEVLVNVQKLPDNKDDETVPPALSGDLSSLMSIAY